MVDFGSDNAFGQVDKKLQEHYGISAPTSSARIITLHHAHEMHEIEKEPVKAGGIAQSLSLAETDGSMIPITTSKPKPVNVKKHDARKHKTLSWREARLTFARPVGARNAKIFAATLGSVQDVGKQLKSCVQRIGYNTNTKVHCVGDGAPWIVNQVKEQFGDQATFLIDLYHVCEYLSAASVTCGGKNQKRWTEEQKDLLKSGRLNFVLMNLMFYLEENDVPEAEAPVRRCFRYLDNRQDQLDYAKAIANGLPIGSGEIESSHRNVIQKRLKIPGAYWKEENAADMLSLCVNKANNDWDGYWAQKKAA